MPNPFGVDQTYVISIKALREVLREISNDRERWWIEDERERSVVIGYGKLPDSDWGINNILFEFPKVASIPIFTDGDGEIVCLYPASREAIQRGLYWEGERLLNDEFCDWETFWPTIQTALKKRYSGLGLSSTAPDTSSSSPRRSTM